MSTVLAALEAAVARASASGDTTPVMDLVVRTGVKASVTAGAAGAVKPRVFIRRGGVVSTRRYAESVGDLLHRLVQEKREEELNAAMQVVASHLLSRGYSRSAIKAAGKKAIWFVANEKGLAASAARLSRYAADLQGVRCWEAAFGKLNAAGFLRTLKGPPALLRAFESELAWKDIQSVPVSTPKVRTTAKERTAARLAKARAKSIARAKARVLAQREGLASLQAQVEETRAQVVAETKRLDRVVIFHKEDRDDAEAKAKAIAHKAAVVAKAQADARVWAQAEVVALQPRLESLLGDDSFVADLSRISSAFGMIASHRDAVNLVRSVVSAMERAEARARKAQSEARAAAFARARAERKA